MTKFYLVLCIFGVQLYANPSPSALLLSYEKVTFSNSRSDQKIYTYKVFVNDSFLAQFKNPSSATSSGTQFDCVINDGYQPLEGKGLAVHRWFSPWNKGRIQTWAFALGSQMVKGLTIYANSPGATDITRFADWNSLDAEHTRGFINEMDGVNIGYSVKSVNGSDPQVAKALLATIHSSDGSILVQGDPEPHPVKIHCSFQEG